MTLRFSKYADATGSSHSMRIALQDLGLAHLYIIYPGEQVYPLDEKITVMPLGQLAPLAEKLNSGDF